MCNIGKIKNVIENEAGPIIAPIITKVRKIMEPVREYVYVRRIQRVLSKGNKR